MITLTEAEEKLGGRLGGRRQGRVGRRPGLGDSGGGSAIAGAASTFFQTKSEREGAHGARFMSGLAAP